MFIKKLCAALTLAALAVSNADATPAISISGGTTGTNGSWSLGWSFVANQAITVTELGFYDAGANGLTQSHQVGLYNASGTLLTSGVVQNSDTLLGSFRYTDVSDVILSAGSTYILAAVTGSEAYNFGGTVTVDPAITFGTDLFISSTTLAFPTSSSGTKNGWFGPNMQYANNVPEPSTIALLGLSLLGLGLSRRKAKQG